LLPREQRHPLLSWRRAALDPRAWPLRARSSRAASTSARTFHAELARARKALGADKLPVIRLHDLRHTHATILLTAREPVHVVSQRLGHASGVITQTVYAHVLPGSQREAAERFASLIERGKAQ
jgi:integrase